MKLTKKIISVVLALIMAVSTMPMTVFAATTNSADDAAAANLKSAITAYETKMNGTVYTNMQAAYDAYVSANKAYDAYVYGDSTSIDLSAYATALSNATTAMTEFTGKTANGVPKIGSSTVPAGNYSNLLYANSGSDTDYSVGVDLVNGSVLKYGHWGYVYYPTTVFMYTGSGEMKAPVICGVVDKSKRYDTVVRRCYPTGTVSLKESWHGYNDGFVWPTATDYTMGYSASTQGNDLKVDNTGIKRSFGNVFYYETVPTTLLTTVNSTTWSYHDDRSAKEMTLNTPIYVVNYKLYLDTIKSSSYTVKLEDIGTGSYKQGGASAVIAAYTTAINLDPNSYFTSSADVNGCINAMQGAMDGISNASNTADSSQYQELRKAMDDTKSTYNSPAYDKYTTTSWTNFTTAYDAAKTMMAGVPSSGYNNAADAKTKADALIAAYNALEVNFTPADVFILENTLDDGDVAIKNERMFTADSMTASGLKTNVPQAKTEVWGSEANYKDEASVVDASQQAMVDAWVVTVGEGIAALIVNQDTTTGSAFGYSMNSAIAEANDTTKYSPADYTNWTDVQEAVQKAQAFDPRVIGDTTDTESFRSGIVTAKLDEYVSLTRDVILALKNLKPSFAKIPDGQIASYTTGSATFTAGSDGKHDTSFTYTYPTDVVVFRTKHNASTLQLPDSAIDFYANPRESKLGASYLDSVNIDSSLSNDAGEITSDYDNRDHSFSTKGISPNDYPGKLTKTVSVGTTQYTLTVGKNSAVAGTGILGYQATLTGYFGRDLDGNEVSISSFDWTDSLANTSGTSAGPTGPNGSLVALYGTVKTNASTTMNVPARNIARPAMTTVPVANNSNVSAVVRWSAAGAAARVYYGYTANYATYSQTVYVVDIAGLIDLMNECAALERANYTTTSWNNFQNALTAAKSDMDYANMSAAEVLTACQTRYDNLMNTRDALVEAANNNSIDAVLATAKTIKDSVDKGEAKYSNSTYTAFLNARQAALDAINGQYSDAACLDLVKTQYQSAIDAIATALQTAIDNLASFADFAKLNAAIATVIADDTYSVETLNAFNDYIATLTYANMSEADKATVEADYQSAIDAEATAITNKIKSLVASSEADKSAFDAAYAELADADPDAYSNIAACKAAMDEYKANNYSKLLYENVTVFGKEVEALKTQAEVDAVVDNGISLELQDYDVYVDGVKYGTYKFGQQADVDFNKNCAIYYAYTSNTAENTAKYYTTDSVIHFIVKGNTYLTTKADTGASSVKVTYVNGLKNKVTDTDYVSTGSQITLPEAPAVAYYSFTGYKVDGVNYQPGAKVTVSQATTIVANYELDQPEQFTITVINENGEFDSRDITASYNEKIDLSVSGAYVWTVLSMDDLDTWYNDPESAPGVEKVLAYGENYSFFANDNVAIVCYTEDGFQEEIDLGTVDTLHLDENGSSVTLRESLVDADTKWSIIGTYAIPAGATLVENGILFSKNQSADLKMSNVDSSTVYRFKSSQHTVGNQFVISIKKPAAATPVKYQAYTIYELNGKQYTVVSSDAYANM